MTTSTLTTEDIQEIYESAVHEEATGSEEASFVLECKLDDAGGTGALIRKLIDMIRARDFMLLAVREAQSVPVAVLQTSIGDWEIDTSAGRPILVYKKCSVIEAEDAEYVLSLIKVASAPPNHSEQALGMVNSPVIPDGWAIVPIDATRKMIDAAIAAEESGYDAMHKAMIAAAPTPNK
ncbi:TPA: hypothetical protein ACIAIE_001827 [Serratia fonticola]